MQAMERILDAARWAPSGDNTQPWRFEIVDERHGIVHGFDTREHCVYDLDGHASQLAIGCLLETLAIAASQYGCRPEISRRSGLPDSRPTFDIRLAEAADVVPDPLIPCIHERRVQRRALSTRRLDAEEKRLLTDALSPDCEIVWKEGWAEKWAMAQLLYANAYIRLTTPEAYQVHRAVIEWDSRFSDSRIPDQAIGADHLTLKLMRWAMASWERVDFMNRYLMGTLMPRLQLDMIPGLACGAHFGIVARSPLTSVNDYISAGRCVQRFWLTATRLGLQVQPEMTPLIFARYVREGRAFTAAPRARMIAEQLTTRLKDRFVGVALSRLAFLGRIGAGPPATARSTRLPLAQLLRPERGPKAGPPA